MDDRPEPVRFSELPAGEADPAAPAMPVAAEKPSLIKQAWRSLRRLALGEPLPTGRYAAFISYRQLEPDRAFAISLHRALETYVVPKGLGGSRHLGRVFRDADELAASSDLGSTIREALDRSDWLIVVCSPRSRASRWVDAEIRHFADHGRGRRILAVLIEGEPSQSFPAALLTLKRVTHGPNLVVDADPLAADARPDPSINYRQRLRGALLSLAAPMLGVTLDALVRRDHVRAVRRLTAIVAITVSVLCVLAISLFLAETSRRDARARQLEALERESLLLANLARQQTAAGDAVTGALLALRGLPSRPGDRPIVGEAVGALIEALAQRREGAILKVNASQAVPSPDSRAFIVFANPGESQLWEPSTGRTFPLMHERPVDAAAFAPDGSRLVTGDWNGNAKVWSRQGEVIRTFRPHTDGFVLLDFSANGQELFSVSQDGTARKTTLDGDSTVLNTGNAQRPFRSAAFHRASATLAAGRNDGKVFIRGGNGLHRVLEPSASDYEPALAFDHQARHLLVRWPKSGTVVFDMASERRTAVAVGPDATAGAISPDGGTVVAGKRNGAVSAWSAATGQLIADLPGHAAEVTDVRFSPNGDVVATSSEDGNIKLWRTAGWRPVASLGAHLGVVYRIAFSPDGEALVSTSFDETVRTWAVRSPRDRSDLKGHTNAVQSAVTSADGGMLATASRDGSVRLWNLGTGQGELLARPMTGPVFDAAFGPAPGQLTLNAWDKNLEVWSLRPMRRLRMFAVARDTVGGSVSPEGRLVLTNAGGKPQLVDISSGSVVLDRPPGASPVGAFHPSRPLFLLVSDEEVTLLEPSGRLLARAAIRAAASEVGYASDGSLAFVRQTNGDVVVLDGLTLDRKVVLPGHDEFSRVILLPACRTAVTTSRPGRVHVWDLSSGASRYKFSMRDELPRLSASPDCARLSIIGDDLVRVISLADGSDIAVLEGHSAKIRFAKFLPQPGTMLSADEAGTIHRWQLPRSIGDLVLDAEQSLPRRLTADQERRFGLR